MPNRKAKGVIGKMASYDRINARLLNEAGDTVSGLDLSEIGESGHGVANLLWKISAYLRKRDS